MNRRLCRSSEDRVIAGVAGGMAETYDLDPALVRLGWALLIIATGGVFLVLYIVLALVVPLGPLGAPLWQAAQASMGTEPGAPAGPPSAVPPGPGAADPTTPAPPSPGYDYHRHPRHREGNGALVVGLILIVVGGFFLARQFVPALNLNLLWPLIIITGGVLLILAAFSRPRSDA